MKTLLSLPLPSRTSSIILEHLLFSLACGSGLFALAFFGPSDADIMIWMTDYFLTDHPDRGLMVLGCLIVVVNLYIIFKNSRKHHIVGIQYDDDHHIFHFDLISMYSNRAKQVSIPKQELGYGPHHKSSFLLGNSPKEFGGEDIWRKSYIRFYHENKYDTTQEEIGRIDPEGIIWQGENRLLRKTFAMLKQVR